MAELNQTARPRAHRRKVHHRGRLMQVSFLFGKLLRMFVYQSDWKVLPMAALIAALVSMVVKRDFFLTMEGTLKGALAVTCVAIWNGCFNSIQVVCRERGIIKREHRSGMHISAYIVAHMLYQALLCLAQTVLTLYVCSVMGVRFPQAGFITQWFLADLGITIFLITYASDMLSLWVSCLAHSTTTAMTVMPFLLIFQLVFSGGIFALPAWCQPLSDYTISRYGITCIAAQANYNNTPMVTAWNTVQKLRDKSIGGTVTLGQALDFLSDDSKEAVRQIRALEVGDRYTVGQVWKTLRQSDSWKALLAKEINADALFPAAQGAAQPKAQSDDVVTVGEALELVQLDKLMDTLKDYPFGRKYTVGEVVDFIANNPDVQQYRDKSVALTMTVGQLLGAIGEERAETIITRGAAESGRIAAYDQSYDNVLDCWVSIMMFIFGFALLAVLTLEPIDRDKR